LVSNIQHASGEGHKLRKLENSEAQEKWGWYMGLSNRPGTLISRNKSLRKRSREESRQDITCSSENQKDHNLLLYKFAHHVQINVIPQFLHGKAQDTTNYNAFYVVLEGNKRLWFYCVFESC
jgi:hypothetical protein